MKKIIKYCINIIVSKNITPEFVTQVNHKFS